ncbi:LppP/LprE family lipoprotein [Streptomyces avermitilis]|uniref:LppP/LprE family lipoprotein n=1 Tax=Streptomyces avermitilis TaxID=33903 RepID=UPI0033E84518
MTWQDPIPAILLGELPVEIGPIPTVFLLSGALIGSLEIGAKADLSFAFDQSAELTAGVTWENGKAGKISNFHSNFSIKKAPSGKIEGAAKAGVRFALTVDGIAGPKLDITQGCKLEVGGDLAGARKIEVKCGIEASAGFELDFFGEPAVSAEVGDLYHDEKVYYSHEWKPGEAVSTPRPKSSTPDFDSEAAKRLIEDMGYTVTSSPPADDPGPLYAFTGCACGGDGSISQVFFFHGSHYVGYAADFHARVIKQDGSNVTVGYQERNPSDPQCCASGAKTSYQVHWDGSQLSSPAQESGDDSGPAVELYSICRLPGESRDEIVQPQSLVGVDEKAVLTATPAEHFCAPNYPDDGFNAPVDGSRTYRFAPGATIELLKRGGTAPFRVALAELAKFLEDVRSGDAQGSADFSVRMDSQGRIQYLSQLYHP